MLSTKLQSCHETFQFIYGTSLFMEFEMEKVEKSFLPAEINVIEGSQQSLHRT